MVRVFIAIDFPLEISGIKEKINFNGVKVLGHFHLTLKFLGEVSDERIKEIKEKLSKLEYPKFKVKTTHLGVFPSQQKIRVVWVGLNHEKEFKELHDKIEESLNDFDEREFEPHLTVARVKFLKNKKNFKEKVRSSKVEEQIFEINKVILKKSTLTPEGPVYEDLFVKEF